MMTDHRILKRLVLALAMLLPLSCSQAPKQISFFVEDPAQFGEVLWPDLPEVPRYRYAGQLLGEDNFVAPEGDKPGTLSKMWKWVAGIGGEVEGPERSLVRPQSGMVAGSRIYVTDVGRGAVFVFDKAKGELQIWDQVGDGGSFVSPIGITSGKEGSVLVADSELGRVVRLSADGKTLGTLGEGILARPTGLVRDPVSKLTYVVDTSEHNIKLFDDNGSLVEIIGQRGELPGEFNAPTHIALSGDRLYVTDTLNARIQVLDLEGEPLKMVGKRGLYLGNLTRPKGVTVDADDNIYVVESYYDHLLVFDNLGEFLLPIGGTGNTVGQFYLPSGVWNDQMGRIYVADMYNGRVMILQFLGG
jgi:DNA-binding beta-propeller fold protein YncE